MEQIPISVESLVIQGGIGRDNKYFNLSYLSSLTTLLVGSSAFECCDCIVFDSELN